ncbi:hypothetical protein HOLleu_13950 [Holothuria leucospilota]|uniref:DUF4371 domain-containing protein n=1 Tax=Holothuria leucospilota TaxID=206669 RepID=A0A9Q1C6Z5_HOLLE|nr:hypothetical protein HOLleu_13950 [Holothuria leucospilota]
MEWTTCSYKRTDGIACVTHKRIVENMKPRPFSINLDECTNNSNERVLSILVSYFSDTQGPRIEQSFSIMNHVVTKKTNRLDVETFSANQTVKYDLMNSGESAIQRYHRANLKWLCHVKINGLNPLVSLGIRFLQRKSTILFVYNLFFRSKIEKNYTLFQP